jgi:hypothetical protein
MPKCGLVIVQKASEKVVPLVRIGYPFEYVFEVLLECLVSSNGIGLLPQVL